MKYKIIILLLLINSCALRKDIVYLQDLDKAQQTKVNYQYAAIQPNDVLRITVESLLEEAAIPFNRGNSSGNGNQQNMLLEGYLVSKDNTINFPVLGEISTKGKTIKELEKHIGNLLIDGELISNPIINVRLINFKITILGEVASPGTYSFTEQNISILQALGYAGDLTINGQRDDIMVIREVDGIRRIGHIDITNSEFMNSEFYFLKPNDNIYIKPNNPKVKKAGYIGDLATLFGVVSFGLSLILLTTR